MNLLENVRYTNADLHGDPNLITTALNYLANYRGTFQPLIEMKRVMEDGYQLSYDHVRIILNTMRNDPKVINMPKPKQEVHDAGGKVLDLLSVRARRKKSEEARKLEVKFKLHKPYLISTNTTAQTIHRTDFRKTKLYYYTAGPFFELDIRSYCKYWYGPHSNNWALAVERGWQVRGLPEYMRMVCVEDALMMIALYGKRWCPQCINIEARVLGNC